MGISRCFSVEDFRRCARASLPFPVFDFLEGGSDDEITLRDNAADFEQVRLVPRSLRAAAELTLGSTLLGRSIAAPIMLAPTGMNRLFHHRGERAVARAARKLNLYYSLSTLSTVSIEEIAGISDGPNCFQIYVHRDRSWSLEFIERCRETKFSALSLTVDAMVGGNRERDLRSGMTIPPRISLRGLSSLAAHPKWSFNHLARDRIALANLVRRGVPVKLDSIHRYVAEQLAARVTWDDAQRLVEAWKGPFAIKGILSAEDAIRAAEIGATAVILSNHGGRQLDGSCSPIQQLPEVVAAVGGRLEIIVEGGVRRGTHVAKALALGANAVSIGRPYLYALAAGGDAGVERLLGRLVDEFRRAMILLGCNSVEELSLACVRSNSVHVPAVRSGVEQTVGVG